MLTGKQKRYLRSLAHHLDPIFQVGKAGVNEAQLRSISEALDVRELVKISILTSCEDDRFEVSEALASGTGAELVQTIGKTVVLYKQAREEKDRKIQLP
ncbi:ribosome assembly RNA-binding protein YhbY [Paenibacillus thermoaerophilus]|jgi:RNA-binding protein|uniref:Ribosome assembly RNA-binding protein YhbY n=1 Tax=Paenibacillus thermoaerophilus TaxID=1215385 RepID=A0ABW2UXB0_9BACL|nr:ribosome assembly RNA-binding protein YhbY [Paenibacillus thermoaerophilus]TMV18965.1 ribosome assembly RNA-binding protein YhbY [Paenibacillus thermoaerophilus]